MSEEKTKVVYQLDYSGYYYGETLADESPLEPGVWHIPAGCVELAPPTIPPGKAARWVNGRWAIVPIPSTEQEDVPAPVIPAQVIPEQEEFAPIPSEEPEQPAE